MVYWGQIREDKHKLGQIMTYLISLLVKFSCELGQIMTRYDFLSIGQMSDSEQCSKQLQLELIMILVNFSCELG